MYRYNCERCKVVVIRKSSNGRPPKYCPDCKKVVQSSQVRKNYLQQNREQYKSVYRESGINAYAKHVEKE